MRNGIMFDYDFGSDKISPSFEKITCNANELKKSITSILESARCDIKYQSTTTSKPAIPDLFVVKKRAEGPGRQVFPNYILVPDIAGISEFGREECILTISLEGKPATYLHFPTYDLKTKTDYVFDPKENPVIRVNSVQPTARGNRLLAYHFGIGKSWFVQR